MRYALATALAASAALCISPALASGTRYQIDIRATDLANALAMLSAQTGVSFASDGPMPRGPARAVRGRMTVEEALDRMLRPFDLIAMRVGGRAYRIVRRKPASDSAPARPASDPPVEDIVVTGLKQSEKLSRVAAPVAVYLTDSDDALGVAATKRSVARETVGLALANNGPGRDRLFIRGIADSAFNGFSQSTVSVYLDDARVTFDASEPGLRLVDVARVEVLKGPQGPLYGTGALGGVYRIVTNRPVLGATDTRAGLGVSSTSGGIGGQAEAMINLPLIQDRAAIRIVGYAEKDPGWIDDAKFGRGLNWSTTRGVRVAVRAMPFDNWTVDLTGMIQSHHVRDSQYLPQRDAGFVRDLPIREPGIGKVTIVQNTIAGSIGPLRLTIATGLTRQLQRDLHDTSAWPAASPWRFYADYRDYIVFTQEIRLGSAPGNRFAWVAGTSFMLSRTETSGMLLSGNEPMPGILTPSRRVIETAVFADASFPLLARVRIGMGLRGFWTDTRNEHVGDQMAVARGTLSATPSASLSYEIAPDQLIYARFGTAFRPGGLDAGNATTRRYLADEVRSIDLGGRIRLDRARLNLDGSLFATDWTNLQSDYLQPNSLIATRNAGRAKAIGAELSADWRLADGWRLQAGAIWQRPRLTRTQDGSALTPSSRLPVIPDISARLALAREVQLDAWRITPGLSANFIGSTHVSLDPDLDRRVPAHVIGRLGISAERDRLILRAEIDNLLDTAADTASFGNPFSARTTRQYTPVRPRTLSLAISRRF